MADKDKSYSINVRVWVLGLSVLSQDTWGDLVNLGNQLEHRVRWEMGLGECALSHVTRISLAENSVSVTWDDLASLEGGPEVVLDSLVAQVITNG